MSVTATPASLAPDHHAQFIDLLQSSLDQNAFIKLVLAKYVGDEADLQRIIIKPLTVKDAALPVLRLSLQDPRHHQEPAAGRRRGDHCRLVAGVVQECAFTVVDR